MRVTEYSGVTIVSALFNGIGVTLGVDLKMEVELVPGTGKISGGVDDTPAVIDYIFKREGVNPGSYDIVIRSDIPHSVGLKSSSSFTLALLTAIQKLKNSRIDYVDAIIRSCKYSKEIGISYTGAMDDAVAVHYGGLNFVDNVGFRILHHYDVFPQGIMISVPPGRKKKVTEEDMRHGVNENREALKMAERLDFGESSFLNSKAIASVFGYDLGIIGDLRKLRGVKIAGFSGTGPSFYAIYNDDGRTVKELEDYFQGFGDYIVGRLR